MANLFPAQFSRLSTPVEKKANQQQNRRGRPRLLDEDPNVEVIR